MDDKFLSLSEAAQELSLTRNDVKRLVHDGKLTGYQFGRYLQFKADDLALFIEASRVQAGLAYRFDGRGFKLVSACRR
jgi:excisionase family DNA binding protein